LLNGEVKNSEFVDISSRFAAGGTRSTVPDLLKFAKGIMEGSFMTSESMLVASTSMSTREGRLTNYAMGWKRSRSAEASTSPNSVGKRKRQTCP